MNIDPEHYFVDEPRSVFVDEAARTAVDSEPPASGLERAWERAHPEGRTAFLGESGLVLWNFAVGEATLKQEHITAIGQFLGRHRLRLLGGALLRVEGHASATGGEAGNVGLSRRRAETVAALVMLRGIPSAAVAVSAAGERRPLGGGETPEALARDRRVELAVVVPVRPDPDEDDDAPPPVLGGPEPRPSSGGVPSPQLPAAYVRFTHKIGPAEFPSRLGVLMLEAEVTLARTDPGTPSNLRLDVQGGRLKPAFETWLNDQVRLVVGERSAIGFAIGDVVLDIEFKLLDDQGKPSRWPVTLSGSIPPRLDPIEIDGARFLLLGGKLRGWFRPSAELLRWLAARGQAILARIAPWAARAGQLATRAAPALLPLAYVAWLWWGIEQLNEDHRRGRQQGLLANVRRGYARRIAYAALALPADASAIEGSGGFEEAREATRLGWTLADDGWSELTRSERATIARALASQGAVNATNTVLAWIGGVWTTAPLPHPRELLARAQTSLTRYASSS